MTVPDQISNAGHRELPFRDPLVGVEHRADGAILVWQEHDVAPAEPSIAHLFAARAQAVPDRVLLAESAGDDRWETICYGEMLERSLRIAAGLLARGLAAGDRIMILSGPGIDHAALAFGAMFAGMIAVPISTGYSLVADRSRLRHAIGLVRPALVFADDAGRFAAALGEGRDAGAIVLAASDGSLAKLADRTPIDLDAALATIAPGDVFKLLLTSGSTALPKAVIQTHAMSCASLAFEASLSTLPPGVRDPEVVLDWMPWSHVGGGITIFNNILFAGASLYLDPGRPVAGQFAATIRNLKAFPQAVFSTPPIGLAMLADAMDDDAELRDRVFSRLVYVKSGGAAMPEESRRKFQRHAVAQTGGEIPILMGYGTTETHGVLSANHDCTVASTLGLPKPGVLAKLVPDGGGGYELRVKAASVTPGYFADDAATAAAFDAEGFFKTGDGVAPAPGGVDDGLLFTGRSGDSFKTATGTWIAGSELRAAVLNALDGEALDCVIVGEGQLVPGAFLWIDGTPGRRERICDKLRRYNETATGESRRIGRIVFSAIPISTERFERTEKGSLNRVLILKNRAGELAALYAAPDGVQPADVVDLAAAQPL